MFILLRFRHLVAKLLSVSEVGVRLRKGTRSPMLAVSHLVMGVRPAGVTERGTRPVVPVYEARPYRNIPAPSMTALTLRKLVHRYLRMGQSIRATSPAMSSKRLLSITTSQKHIDYPRQREGTWDPLCRFRGARAPSPHLTV